MAVDIFMRGLIEPVRIEGNFEEALSAINLSVAKGNQFCRAITEDNGDHIALNMPEILTIREVEQDMTL